MIGIKLVNLYTNKVKMIISKNENLRFINLALCKNDGVASDNKVLDKWWGNE